MTKSDERGIINTDVRRIPGLLLDAEDYERQTGFPLETFDEFQRRVENTLVKEPSRQRIPRAIKAAVWAKTNGFCWYCGCVLNPFTNFQIDHRIPLSQGGTDDILNLFPSCARCNKSKGRSNQ